MRIAPLLRGAVAGLALSFAALPARAETLADALVLAYRHSGLLEQNRAVLRAADEDVAQAISTLRPVINYALQAQRTYTFPNGSSGLGGIEGTTGLGQQGDGYEDTASFALTGELLLADGGQSQLAIQAAKETVLATRQSLRQVEQQVLGQAIQAYLSVREAQAFVNLAESQVQLITRELDAAQQRFEVGEVTRTDVALAEAQLAQARSNLSSSLGDLETARSQYVQAVGVAPQNLQPINDIPELPGSLDSAQGVAKQTHPTILSDMRSVTVSELNVLRAEAAVRPSFTANGNLTINQDGEEQAQVGLTMSGPIYRGGAITASYRQAVAQRDEARASLHVTTDEIVQAVAGAWSQFEVAQAAITSGQLQVRAQRVAFEGLQEEATLGARTTLDVLQAEQDLRDAQASLISAQISEIRSAYSILQSMGLLTVDHLDLGVVTYDPSAYYSAVENAPVQRVSPQGEKLDTLLRRLGRN